MRNRTSDEQMEAAGYIWVGSISYQFGAWLAYWVDFDGGFEEYTAHGNLASAKRWVRKEAYVRYTRAGAENTRQFAVWAKAEHWGGE